MTVNLPVSLEALPGSLLDVAEVLGFRIALALMQHFGGQEVKFPRKPGPGHAIIRALGEADGLAVCELLAGCPMYIPNGHAARSARPEVLAMAAKGMTRSEIARTLNLSMRHVRRVANARRRDARQLDLFAEN